MFSVLGQKLLSYLVSWIFHDCARTVGVQHTWNGFGKTIMNYELRNVWKEDIGAC